MKHTKCNCNEWFSISTAPKDGELFIGWYQVNSGFGRTVICAWRPDVDEKYPWWGYDNSFAEDKITHWKPLPTPPQEREE